MSYRIIDPTPINFADGLDLDDPMRDPANCPDHFGGYADPHADAGWLLVAAPVAELNPDEFVLDGEISVRRGWSPAHPHRSGKSEREVVEGMATTLRSGGSLRPPIATEGPDGRLSLVDGFHRIAACRTAGLDEMAVYLLVARA